MLDQLTHRTFSEHVGSCFTLHASESESLPLELYSVTPLRIGNGSQPGREEPFSLMFRGPKEVYAPQNTYALEHISLGTLYIFLVPVGPDETGMRYEAIFN